jgi:hypothetical protein
MIKKYHALRMMNLLCVDSTDELLPINGFDLYTVQAGLNGFSSGYSIFLNLDSTIGGRYIARIPLSSYSQ